MKNIAKFLQADHDKRVIIRPVTQPELHDQNDFKDMKTNDIQYDIDDLTAGLQ